MFLNESSHTTKENLLIPWKIWINKQNYNAIKCFKEKMATKLPWVELFTREDGSLHIVKCRVYIEVENKDKLFAHKWDFLYKYAHYKKANRIMGSNVKNGLVQWV